jgi:hypothetical protein
MRAHQGRYGSRDNWCVLEYNTQTKEADRLINYDGAVRKISVPTVVLCLYNTAFADKWQVRYNRNKLSN